MDAETRTMIKDEIKRQLNILVVAQTGSTTQDHADIDNLFPGMPTVTNRPVVHPYGFVSRAARGMQAMIGRVGDHLGSRWIMGYLARDRPKDIGEGETFLYTASGYQVRLRAGIIELGKNGDFEPMVVGETLRQFLISQVQDIIEHHHIGNLGFLTGPPDNAEAFQELQDQNLDNKKILAQDGGRYAT